MANARSGPETVRSRSAADSRDRLLAAAATVLSDRGYFQASVDEIAAAAGVSRVTFYRHFKDKAALAATLFRISFATAMPMLLSVGERDWRSRDTVVAWIGEVFSLDRAHARLLRVFVQANVDAPEFAREAQTFLAEMIMGLGRSIPAFAIDRTQPAGRRRWLEAWLLVYELLDQSNHAALGSGQAVDPLMIDVLADRFLQFVGVEDAVDTAASLPSPPLRLSSQPQSAKLPSPPLAAGSASADRRAPMAESNGFA